MNGTPLERAPASFLYGRVPFAKEYLWASILAEIVIMLARLVYEAVL